MLSLHDCNPSRYPRFRGPGSYTASEKILRTTLITAGILLWTFGTSEDAMAFASAKNAIKEICGHMSGNLGALLMSAAGVGAIISGAMGNFKASLTLIIVGVGAFTIAASLSLFFPQAGEVCLKGSEPGIEGIGDFPNPNQFGNVARMNTQANIFADEE